MKLAALGIALLIIPTLALAQTKTVVQTPQRETVTGSPTLQLFGPGASQSDLCIGEVSGAYGNSVLAVTVDITRRDQVCARLRKSWFLCSHDLCPAGIQLQCMDAEVHESMKRAGTPCEAQVASSPSPDAGK